MSKKIIFTENQTKDIIDLYKNNSIEKISKQYNVYKTTIKNLLINNNINIRNNKLAANTRKRKFSENEKNDMIDLYQNNSIDYIKNKYKTDYTTIINILKEKNIKLRTLKEQNTLRYINNFNKTGDEIISLYKNGTSITNLSIKFNMNYKTVSNFLNKNNIKIRSCCEQLTMEFIDKIGLSNDKLFNSETINNLYIKSYIASSTIMFEKSFIINVKDSVVKKNIINDIGFNKFGELISNNFLLNEIKSVINTVINGTNCMQGLMDGSSSIIRGSHSKAYIKYKFKNTNLYNIILNFFNSNNIKFIKNIKSGHFILRVREKYSLNKIFNLVYINSNIKSKQFIMLNTIHNNYKCKICNLYNEKLNDRKNCIDCLNNIKVMRKIHSNISKGIRAQLKSKKITKKKSILKILPYSISELKTHIESLFEPWMTWNNWGVYSSKLWDDNNCSTWTWHLDHIESKGRFLFSNILDKNFQRCWSLSNLRPLSAKQNVLDGMR